MMQPIYWILFVFVTLLTVLLLLKILKGVFKITILSASLILVLSALVFTYSLVTDQSFTGLVTGGVNYTKDKAKNYLNEKAENVKEYVVENAVETVKESAESITNQITSEKFLNSLLEKEKFINNNNSTK